MSIKNSCQLTFANSTLVVHVKELCNLPSADEAVCIIAGLRWMGLFSTALLTPRAGNLLDTLSARLDTLMAYAPGERDLLMLQHKFVIEWADGRSETRTSTLEAYGAPTGTGPSAMARYNTWASLAVLRCSSYSMVFSIRQVCTRHTVKRFLTSYASR